MNISYYNRCLEYLLRNDANPGIRDKQGYNAVHYSAAYGHRLCLQLVRILSSCGRTSVSLCSNNAVTMRINESRNKCLVISLESVSILNSHLTSLSFISFPFPFHGKRGQKEIRSLERSPCVLPVETPMPT